MNKKRRCGKLLLSVCLICLTGISAGACGVFDKEVVQEMETEDEDLIVVGFSQLGSESMWRTGNTASIQNALSKENGFFLQFHNARQKQENQIKAIRSFISQRVDYIVFAPVMEEGWETVLTEAKEAGIPVILVDRAVSGTAAHLYTTRVGTDGYWEGKQAGLWLEEDLKKKGQDSEDINIVVLQGTPGASIQIGRTNGFAEVANTHSNWKILDQQSADFTTAKGKEVMQQYLKKHEDIDVLFSQNDDMTFGAIEALREAGIYVGEGDDIRIISIDGSRDALQLVAEGVIDVDVECNPEQGEMVAEVIRKMENDEEIEREYIVEDCVFTKDNVEEYIDSRTY